MKLKRLLKQIPEIEVKGSREIEITGISSHSRSVAPGNLFIAKPGLISNGADFIPEALEAGATALLTDIYDPSLRNITQLLGRDIATLEAAIAAEFYGHPSRELFVVGITGTNGKTTTAFLVQQLLQDSGLACGLIGTIEYILGTTRYTATRTTPDVITNQKILREMVLHNCEAAVMEVTSHALVQGRTSHIEFDIGIFTNLSQDHLDYHGSMEAYAAAKARLFEQLQPPYAIVNLDDPWQEHILERYAGERLTFSTRDPSADLFADEIVLQPDATSAALHYKGDKSVLHSALTGRFNVQNLLAAAAVGLIKGLSLLECTSALGRALPAEGRMEPVPNSLGLKIYVDFAHTPDALQQVLETLQELSEAPLCTVIGCGGDRDREKRPLMGRIAAHYSDRVIITSDNPRSEDPEAICQEVAAGSQGPGHIDIEPDRAKAIRKAIWNALPGEIILIAGKGHETFQVFAHRTLEFDDRRVAKALCEERGRATR